MDTNPHIRILDWAADFENEPVASSTEPGQADALALPLTTPKETPTETNSLPSSILSNWGQITEAKISMRMYNELVRLSLRPDGWRGPGSKTLQSSSLSSFLRFWSKVQNGAVEPELALAPDGSIHAEWFRSPQKHLDVRFSNDRLIFGLINGGSIIEGADHVDIITEILRSHYASPLTWSTK